MAENTDISLPPIYPAGPVFTESSSGKWSDWLDRETRVTQQDAIRKVIEEMAQSPIHPFVAPPQQNDPVFVQVPIDLSSLERRFDALQVYLGLSPQERSFLKALAEAPGDRVLLAVFCDWLKEQGREADAALLGG
jgi:uncharacterized protein (TIGR02996 family)